MIKEKAVSYKIAADGTFTVENYASAPPFSNFLPAVAGPQGIPLWAFYVNRGQCMASFGIRDKDHAIMEFLPADQSYVETPLRGFRTFIKLQQKTGFDYYEPFQSNLYNQRFDLSQSLSIRPWDFSLQEKNISLGLDVDVEYFGVPQESLGVLGRVLKITNKSALPIQLELVDGLPRIVPFGLNDFFLKNMSRTAEAWARAQMPKAREGAVFYHVNADPFDDARYKEVEGVNFYTAVAVGSKGKTLEHDYLADPEALFGTELNFSQPFEFLKAPVFEVPRSQILVGRYPCAFSFLKSTLLPTESLSLYSYVGQAGSAAIAMRLIPKFLSQAYFLEKKRENALIIKRLAAPITTLSASREYDLYSGQTYLDNVLRGGYPWVFEAREGVFVLPVYSRRHGDPERDYNRFVVQSTYLSQGDGNYRDVNQNRRMDVWFEPKVGDSHIRTFMNAIQLDGFNPLIIKGVRLKIHPSDRLRRKLSGLVAREIAEQILSYLAEPRTPGELLQMIELSSPSKNGDHHALLQILMKFSDRTEDAEYGEGFWTDHWFYNIDLLESYLAIYPEELENLFLKKKDFTFFDDAHYVKPRRDKYVVVKGRVRQYQAVSLDIEKERLIKGRSLDPNKMRTRNGRGRVYTTTLTAKLVSLTANKYASLDPQGTGLEMEADRPDWLDALNGLPGLLGSSISGTLELLRLVELLADSLESIKGTRHKVALPTELAEFLMKLTRATDRVLGSEASCRSLVFWNKTHDAKEAYWEKTRFGIRGPERVFRPERLVKILRIFQRKLKETLDVVTDPAHGVPPTYFINEVVDFRIVKRSGKDKSPVVVPKKFRQHPLPSFLEGPVHAIRIEKNIEKARRIYNAVRASVLFDRPLGMYRLGAPLDGVTPEIGRILAFAPGWLENQSVFLHMEYKFLLALLKKGLTDEFFIDMRTALIAFQDPKVYGRNIFENSSFLTSSAFPDKKMHGRGFVARLSGSTSEFLEMWTHMNIGPRPFFLDDSRKLALRIQPILPAWLFTQTDAQREVLFPDGTKISLFLPKRSFAFIFLGRTLVTYHNPKGLSTYGPKRAAVTRVMFTKPGTLERVMVDGDVLSYPYALDVRGGKIARLDVELG